MKEWKINQLIYHKTHIHDDVLNHATHAHNGVANPDIVVSYFTQEWGQLHYPEKSYCVGIIYAKLLERYFKEPLLCALDDGELLIGDLFFVQYSHDKHTYDAVMDQLTEKHLWDFENSNIPQVKTTVSCFKREFLLV